MSEDETMRDVWADRQYSYTETVCVDETVWFVDDPELDIDEVRAISEASAISMLEALKA